MSVGPQTAVLLEESIASLVSAPTALASSDPSATQLRDLVRSLLLERSAVRPGSGVGRSYARARDIGRQCAERRGSLEPLLKTVREAGREIWQRLLDSPPLASSTDLADLGALLWEVVDQISEHLSAGFHASTEARFRADEHLRMELWEGLLGGMVTDPAFGLEAVRALGLAGSPYVAIEVEDGRPLDLAEACVSTTWLQRHTSALGLVTITDGGYDALLRRLGECADRPIGVSTAVAAVSRLATVFTQASQAVRTRMGVPGVTAFEDAVPAVLLQGSPEVTEHLVLSWLGPLLELPLGERDDLLETLRVWVDVGGSPSAAAAALYCHRNTVLNRMRRITELLDRELTLPPRLELALALRAVEGLRIS